jgi:hypothetical protein
MKEKDNFDLYVDAVIMLVAYPGVGLLIMYLRSNVLLAALSVGLWVFAVECLVKMVVRKIKARATMQKGCTSKTDRGLEKSN